MAAEMVIARRRLKHPEPGYGATELGQDAFKTVEENIKIITQAVETFKSRLRELFGWEL
jgi:hypothetical protein